MSLNVTTLSAAVGANDTSLLLASITGVTTPSFQSGSGITYLLLEQEWCLVLNVGTSATVPVAVKRGQLGSCAVAHTVSTPVLAGLPSDFPGPIPISIKANQDFAPDVVGWSSVVAVATNVVAASGPFFHLTGTTIVKSITQPPGTNAISGQMIGIVFDGSGAGLTWDATGNIATAGTSGTTGTLVFFVYDANVSKWYPSRIL